MLGATNPQLYRLFADCGTLAMGAIPGGLLVLVLTILADSVSGNISERIFGYPQVYWSTRKAASSGLQSVLLVGLKSFTQSSASSNFLRLPRCPRSSRHSLVVGADIFCTRAVAASWLIETPTCLASSLSCLCNDP
jgi:hypothetical protein